MASWSGFTDEELRRLKQQTKETNKDRRQENLKKAAVANSCRKQRLREKIRTQLPVNENSCGVKTNARARDHLTESCSASDDNREQFGSSAEQSFSKTTPPNNRTICNTEIEVEEDAPESERIMSNNNNKKENITTEEKPMPDDDVRGSRDINMTAIIRGENQEPEIDEPKRNQAIELSTLQKMQSKQKQMEEENKKKKAFLQQAIAERYKRTQKETRTLAVVGEELKRLDSLLSADVAILRDKIEAASIEYLQAQKRYERAEAEFVAAKFGLHKKTEYKEQLTAHLYVIIEENEARKARKLEELMTKLELQEDSIQYSSTLVSDDLPDNVPDNANKTVVHATETTCIERANGKETIDQT